MSSNDTRATVCASCGRLISRNEPACPHCGASRTGWRAAEVLHGWVSQRGVSNSILAVNALAFLAGLLLTRRLDETPPGFLGALSIGRETSARMGLFYWPLVQATGEYWRFVTASFLHANLLHIAFNLWSLVALAPLLEREYGWARFTLVYLGSGVAGWIACAIWGQPALGASCSLFGLLGAGWALGKRYGGTWGENARAMFRTWAISGVLYSFVIPGVSIPGHLGGLIGGGLLGYALAAPRRRMAEIVRNPPWLALLAGAALLSVPVSFALAALGFAD
ncbi:MAG: rhomboid family intramembrane serine protease [Planctomycetes bacterium]|nr:rhomboid family intramembrane serine protease [Planctomycetota bacterium]